MCPSDSISLEFTADFLLPRFQGLSAEQAAVYGMIDEAGEEGIWTKSIKQRLNLHDAVFRSAVKHLESRNMIADMKSVEHPTRKMYIKSSLRPSDRATGGPWYTDGELDEEFINTIMQILYEYVKKRTFYRSGHSPKRPKKIVKRMTPEEAKAARDKSLGPRVKTEQQDDGRTAVIRDYERYVPMPAGYKGYPTLSELTSYVENSKFTSQTLTATEIEQLLDILCYDDRIEKIAASGQDGFAYKALRKTLLDEDYVSSVLTEAPCGRCPVFDLCEEGGPVGPSNCEYFNDWLNL